MLFISPECCFFQRSDVEKLRSRSACTPLESRFTMAPTILGVNMIAEIYKEFHFESAHRLPNVPDGHKCGRLHGHSFQVRIYVRDKIDAYTGWVVDFSDIKVAFKPILDQLDHYYL